MAKHKQLRDIYRVPGFWPGRRVFGVFGDPRALVIRLKRREKKQSVEPVERFIVSSTTERPAGFAISLAGICGFTWTWRFVASFAAGARR